MSEVFRMSFNQFCSFFDFNPKELVSIDVNPQESSITVLLAEEGELQMQTSGTFPQLNSGKKTKGKGGKRGC